MTPRFIASEGEPLIRWNWLSTHWDDIGERSQQHLLLTAISFFAGLIIASLLASIARRWRWTATPITFFTTILYTVPSIALFAALIPILGTGLVVPAVALTTYSLVVLTPFLIVAFDEVSPATIEAADAMGMTRAQRLFLVELPLALPSIFAGLRITAVTLIGLVTVGGLFGLGGFGNLIDDGLTRDFPTPIVVGVLASVLMAMATDLILVGIAAAISPWRRAKP